MKSKLTYCDVLDKKQLRQVKRFIKELEKREVVLGKSFEVIDSSFVLEYFKTIHNMRSHNFLNESSEMIKIHDYYKKHDCEFQLYFHSK